MDTDSRADAVIAFWRRAAPRFSLPVSGSLRAEAVRESGAGYVYRLHDGERAYIVRWPRGSLLRVDTAQREAVRLFVLAAEMGLAPGIVLWELGALELDGQPAIVTADNGDRTPDAAWFRENMRPVAALLARLHRDADLSETLENMGRGDPRVDALSAARSAWADLQARLDALRGADLPPPFAAALGDLEAFTLWFGTQIQPHLTAFQGQRLGPCHADLRASQWVVDANNRVTLVEWRRLRLEDPALDLGITLHRFIPPPLWTAFAREYISGGYVRPQPEVLLARARVRYPLHLIGECLDVVESQAPKSAPDDDAAAFVAESLSTLRRLRAGTFGAG